MNKVKKIYQFLFKKYAKLTWSILAILVVAYYFCLPQPLFNDPSCMVLEDRTGQLMGARIATDGQWRFPHNDFVPEKFAQALIEFEDRRFYQHLGVDPFGIARAIKQNITNRSIVSGGSTLTMQVIRLARKAKARSLFQKLIETIIATRLELGSSKNEILALYSSNAPFGGNVVGLEAASWRYYAKEPRLLSWAEAATLAVLPNNPSIIHPGRNRKALRLKRDRLLDRLLTQQKIDSLTCQLAKTEPLPVKPHPLPQFAPHLLNRAYQDFFQKDQPPQITKIKTTINPQLQIHTQQILKKHHQQLSANGIHNLAAVIIEVQTGNVLAYVGNVSDAGAAHGARVDVIQAPRSTGSILKPFLYGKMLQHGNILPNSLVADVPTQLKGYRPENFYRSYDGVVPARRALVRSLNIPMVRMLQDYGLEKFHFDLQKMGLTTLNRPANHYGLTLILGGAEASLWDLTNAYAGMAHTLTHFNQHDGLYHPSSFEPASYIFGVHRTVLPRKELLREPPIISAAACWLSFEAMREVQRPNSEGEWEYFQSSNSIAWKTGTSYGFRDAWAIGTNPNYAIGVWAGNADGEGRPGLVGVKAAAPVLFDLFDPLDDPAWFEPSYDELIQVPVCQQSGFRAATHCPVDSTWIPVTAQQAKACPFHQLIHLDFSGQYQVNSDCEAPTEMQHRAWFVLPPIEAYYYQSKNAAYQKLPPFRADCLTASVNQQNTNPIQIIYPKANTKIYVPVDLDGSLSRTVFQAVHRATSSTLHWHLDQAYVGSTSNFHELELAPALGKHRLTLVDEQGHRRTLYFEIMQKESEKE
ncbi:MAG: penicillin-binding protein 1C [Saprospiraceae bacterium]